GKQFVRHWPELRQAWSSLNSRCPRAFGPKYSNSHSRSCTCHERGRPVVDQRWAGRSLTSIEELPLHPPRRCSLVQSATLLGCTAAEQADHRHGLCCASTAN